MHEKQCRPGYGNRGYCKDVPKKVCHSSPVKKCTKKDRQTCKWTPTPKCLKIPAIVPDRKCQSLASQRCKATEKQQCLTVHETVCRYIIIIVIIIRVIITIIRPETSGLCLGVPETVCRSEPRHLTRQQCVTRRGKQCIQVNRRHSLVVTIMSNEH